MPKGPRRRTHQKSHRGCRTCKTRKVKCDEQKPECGNCIKYNVSCDFLTGVQALPQPGQATSSPASSSLTPSSLASGDLDLNLADLELLHHYMTETCATLADQSPALRGFFRDAAVQMGLRDSYVMRMVLAISALHLTHLRGGDVYRARAAAHHRVASQAAVAAMTADVTSQTAPSLFVFAIMTTIYAMGLPQQEPYPGLPAAGETVFPDWLFLFRGLVMFFSRIDVSSPMASALAALLVDGQKRAIAREALVGAGSSSSSSPSSASSSSSTPAAAPARGKNPEGEGAEGQATGDAPPSAWRHLDELEARIRARVPSPELQQMYGTVIMQLKEALEDGWTPPPPPGTEDPPAGAAAGAAAHDIRGLFHWLMRTQETLMPLLRVRDPTAVAPEAAAVLGFFAVTLARIPDRWWTRGWGVRLLARVWGVLGDEHRAWLQWPVREITGPGGGL